MSEPKESFIKGTLILTAAALVARILGIFQRVPLEHMFDTYGNAAFVQANNVYLMLLTLATAGIPSTLSKMISERYALDRQEEAKQIYRAALYFAAVTGVLMSATLYITAPFYAQLTGVPNSVLAIRAIAPALLLFPSIAMMRGYFQGLNNMVIGGISQIVEQIARVITAILLTFILLRQGYSNAIMAAGASFGSVLGSVAAFLVMIYFAFRFSRNNTARDRSDNVIKLKLSKIYKDIFRISIPIVFVSMTIQAVYLIDSSLIVPLLSKQIGEGEAIHLLDILGQKAQSIAGIPPVLAIALSTSLIPVISAAYARQDEVSLKNQITLAFRIAILTGTPIILTLVIAAYPVNGLLFKTSSGSGIVALLTLGTIFQITMTTSNSILLGMGKSRKSMIYVLTGIIAKLVGSIILSQFIGIYGIIIATGICFIVITMLNLRLLKTYVSFKILGDKWGSYFIAVLVASGIGFTLNKFGLMLTGIISNRIAYFTTCVMVASSTVLVYLLLLIFLDVLKLNDFGNYPKVIHQLLKRFLKFRLMVRNKWQSK